MDLAMVMKESGYSYDTLAKKVECSVGVLSKFISKGETIKFDIVLNTIKTILPEREKDFMYSYCLQSDKPNHLKCALEYADIHSNRSLLLAIIEKCRNSSNRELKEYAIYYGLLYDKLDGKKDSADVFKEINSINTSTNDLSVLKVLLEMNYYYQMKQFKRVDNLMDKALESISQIKDTFLRASYQVRYNQMLAYIQLHVHCNPVAARDVSYDSIMLGMGDYLNGFFYNIVATSYFGESLEKMNSYASKSVKHFANLHGGDCGIVHGIRNRYRKLNMIMADNLQQEYTPDISDPIDLYIEGKTSGNTYKLIECLVELNKRGNIFFTDMVKKELRSVGCDESLIQSICTI